MYINERKLLSILEGMMVAAERRKMDSGLRLFLKMIYSMVKQERERLSRSQRKGIARSRSVGVKFGRPRCVLPTDFVPIAARVRSGEMSYREGAARCRMPVSTFRKYVKRLSEGNDIKV